jgi:hypothetical protein
MSLNQAIATEESHLKATHTHLTKALFGDALRLKLILCVPHGAVRALARILNIGLSHSLIRSTIASQRWEPEKTSIGETTRVGRIRFVGRMRLFVIDNVRRRTESERMNAYSY